MKRSRICPPKLEALSKPQGKIMQTRSTHDLLCVVDGGEVVVGQHHLGGLARRLGALPAHRDADIGALQRGRIVHAVAGHRHHFAVGLQRLYQRELMLGAGAREDVGTGYRDAQGGLDQLLLG